jgi:hypothetical protein
MSYKHARSRVTRAQSTLHRTGTAAATTLCPDPDRVNPCPGCVQEWALRDVHTTTQRARTPGAVCTIGADEKSELSGV